MPRALYWRRRATAAVMSTTIRWLVWALVDLLVSIFREMTLRIPLMASVRVPPGQLTGDGLRCGCGFYRGTGDVQVLCGDLAVGAGAGEAGEVNALDAGLVGGQRRHGGLVGDVVLHVPLHH